MKKKIDSKSYTYILFFLILIFSIAINYRNFNTFSLVQGDEFRDGLFSRVLPFGLSFTESYLPSFIYSSTKYCGEYFYSCAKFLNFLFYFSSLYFFYRFLTKEFSKNYSLLVTFIILIWPINFYTTVYFFECFFIFLVTLLIYLSTLNNRQYLFYSFFILVSLALLSTKLIHSLPIIFSFLIVNYLVERKKNKRIILFSATSVICIFILKYLSTSLISLDFNTEVLGNSAINSYAISMLSWFYENLRLGYFFFIKKFLLELIRIGSLYIVLFGLPFYLYINNIKKQSNTSHFLLISLILLYIISSAFVAINPINHHITRYFSYLLPFFIFSIKPSHRTSYPALYTYIFFYSISFFFVFLNIYDPNPSEVFNLPSNPDLISLFKGNKGFKSGYLIIIGSLILNTYYLFLRKNYKLVLIIFTFLFLINSQLILTKSILKRFIPTTAEKAASEFDYNQYKKKNEFRILMSNKNQVIDAYRFLFFTGLYCKDKYQSCFAEFIFIDNIKTYKFDNDKVYILLDYKEFSKERAKIEHNYKIIY